MRQIVGIFAILTMLAASAHAVTPTTKPEAGVYWSNPDLETTPAGEVHYHGPFNRETIDITCDLPARHDFIRVSFDLLIIHTWDGNWQLGADGLPVKMGPDSIRVGLKDGPTLLFTTFSNVPYIALSATQNYPSPVPGDAHPAQAGAKETDTHGYLFPHFTSNPPIKQDSTYHIEYTVPHHDARAVVQISGINLQELLNEYWGVSDFQIAPLTADQVSAPSFDDVGRLFEDARNVESEKRMDSFAKLVCGMENSVNWISLSVTPAPIDLARASQLVKHLSLDDRAREVRDAATKELLGLGAQAEVALRDGRLSATSDGRCRIDKILQSITVTPIADENVRRVMLATRVLEIIGTPGAMEVRRKLVTGK